MTYLPNKQGIMLINNTVSNIFYHGIVVANIDLTNRTENFPYIQLMYNRWVAISLNIQSNLNHPETWSRIDFCIVIQIFGEKAGLDV